MQSPQPSSPGGLKESPRASFKNNKTMPDNSAASPLYEGPDATVRSGEEPGCPVGIQPVAQ